MLLGLYNTQLSRALVCGRCYFITVIKDNDTVTHHHRMELWELSAVLLQTLCCGDYVFLLPSLM